MRLDALTSGQRFTCPWTGLSGTVERVGMGGVAVKLDRCAQVEVGGKTFQRPEYGILSGGTEVTLQGEG